MRKSNKILAYVLAVFVLGGMILLYLETSMKGYPDGHLTELDSAQKPLFFTLCLILMVSGFFLIYLAGFSKWQNRNKIFYGTVIFLLAVIFLVLGIDGYLSSILDNGRGG